MAAVVVFSVATLVLGFVLGYILGRTHGIGQAPRYRFEVEEALRQDYRRVSLVLSEFVEETDQGEFQIVDPALLARARSELKRFYNRELGGPRE